MVLKVVSCLLLCLAVDTVSNSSTEGTTSPDQLTDVNFRSALRGVRAIPQTCVNHSSGIQPVQPQFGFNEPYLVVCDQEYARGGWTVVQNRFDGAVNFYRGWKAYEDGFGDLFGEFWLGLKRIHELTYSRHHELRIVLEDFEGRTVWAHYSNFSVAGAEEKYQVKSLGRYSGTAGDSFGIVLNQYFTTLDVDNDQRENENCAVMYKSGWWHQNCHRSNLNGLYLPGPRSEYATMMCWREFRGYYYGLKSSRMMIRAVEKPVVV